MSEVTNGRPPPYMGDICQIWSFQYATLPGLQLVLSDIEYVSKVEPLQHQTLRTTSNFHVNSILCLHNVYVH